MPSPFEHGFVKVCGVTSVEDARVVAKARASAVGLIFARSPRRVTLEEAREIATSVEGELVRCAVFREGDDDYVLEHLVGLDVEVVQLHGTLSPRLFDRLRDRSLFVVKGLNIESSEFDEFDDEMVDAVLVDGPRSGSGATHSWERLATRQFKVPVIAAGGLDVRNVAAVIEETNVAGVDCASGVERGPREKSSTLVDEFVANARRAFSIRSVA